MNTLTKNIAKIFLSLAITMSITSCQDPILYHINKEVKLEEATILGDIFSIIRVTENSNEKLYIANGNIYSKDKEETEHGKWVKMPAPSGHVHSLAADSTYLYAFVYKHTKETNTGETELESRKIYYRPLNNPNAEWNVISFAHAISQTSDDQPVVLMCTNTTSNSYRQAFARIDKYIYKLNGSTTTEQDTNKEYNSCAYNGSVKFFDSFGACSDANNTYIYYGDNRAVKRVNASGTTEIISEYVRSTVCALAVMQDSILVATLGGTALIDKDDGHEIEFTNLTSTVSTLYENHAALAVWPDRNAVNNIIYATNQVYGNASNSAQFTHEGLWSYLPERNKWNIE